MIAGTSFCLERVDRAWEKHRARIERCGTDEVTLRDIRLDCFWRRAVCLEGPDGMVIVRPVHTSDGKIDLEVLLAVSAGLHGAFKRNEQAMLAIARDMGASTVSFRTDRAGWQRLLGPEWRRQGDTFSREVPDGQGEEAGRDRRAASAGDGCAPAAG